MVKITAGRAFAIGDRVLIGHLRNTGTILNYTNDPEYFWIKLDTPIVFRHGSPIEDVVRHEADIKPMNIIDRIAELNGPSS